MNEASTPTTAALDDSTELAFELLDTHYISEDVALAFATAITRIGDSRLRQLVDQGTKVLPFPSGLNTLNDRWAGVTGNPLPGIYSRDRVYIGDATRILSEQPWPGSGRRGVLLQHLFHALGSAGYPYEPEFYCAWKKDFATLPDAWGHKPGVYSEEFAGKGGPELRPDDIERATLADFGGPVFRMVREGLSESWAGIFRCGQFACPYLQSSELQSRVPNLLRYWKTFVGWEPQARPIGESPDPTLSNLPLPWSRADAERIRDLVERAPSTGPTENEWEGWLANVLGGEGFAPTESRYALPFRADDMPIDGKMADRLFAAFAFKPDPLALVMWLNFGEVDGQGECETGRKRVLRWAFQDRQLKVSTLDDWCDDPNALAAAKQGSTEIVSLVSRLARKAGVSEVVFREDGVAGFGTTNTAFIPPSVLTGQGYRLIKRPSGAVEWVRKL